MKDVNIVWSNGINIKIDGSFACNGLPETDVYIAEAMLTDFFKKILSKGMMIENGEFFQIEYDRVPEKTSQTKLIFAKLETKSYTFNENGEVKDISLFLSDIDIIDY